MDAEQIFEVLERVQTWDADMRIELARRILETVFLLFARRSEGLVWGSDVSLRHPKTTLSFSTLVPPRPPIWNA